MTIQTQKELGVVVTVSLYTIALFLGLAVIINQFTGRLAVLSVLILLSSLVWVACQLFALALAAWPASRLVLIVLPAAVTFLVGRLTLAAFLAAVALGITLAAASRLARHEIRDRVTYTTRHIFYWASRSAAMGLVIAAVGLSWPAVMSSVAVNQLRVEENHLQWLLRPLEPLLGNLLPGGRSTATIDDLINAQLEQQLGALPVGTVVTPAQRQDLLEQLSGRLGQTVSGNQSLAAVIAAMINRQLQAIEERYPRLLAITVALLVVLAARAILPLLVWPILAAVAAIVYLSVQSGLITKLRSQAMIERLQF